MSWSHGERLYNLLPAVHRIRDGEAGEALRAFLSIVEGEVEVLEADIEGLYENAFVETCDTWVIPYIGDLLGVRDIHTVDSDNAFSPRAYVANTIRYRRRKGTATVLEQLARDVTGWPARAVEFFELLGWTQNHNHIRLHNHRTPDLRDTNALELLETPFQSAARTVEVRRIPTKRGRHNIPNVGLFLWRLQSYPVTASTPRPVPGLPEGRYRFDPTGRDIPLFNRPQTETEITHLAEEINVPGRLRRRAVFDDVVHYRADLLEGDETPETDYFGSDIVYQVWIEGRDEPLLPEEIDVCHLAEWDEPGWTAPASRTLERFDESTYDTLVAVDPELGRLVPLTPETTPVAVSYAYGFSGDLGGGPYGRRDDMDDLFERDPDWLVEVNATATASPGSVYNTFTDAVADWNALPAGSVGVIAVSDSATYAESLTGSAVIDIPEGSQLTIIAAGLAEADPEDPDPAADTGRLSPEGVRPHLLGDLSVRGAIDSGANAGELRLHGILVEGAIQVLVGNLGELRLAHCTVVPDFGLTVNPSAAESSRNARLQVCIERSIVGRVSVNEYVPGLIIVDSIVDADGGLAVEAEGAEVRIDTSTILGETRIRELEGSESIFTGLVTAERRQKGCVRFSVLPAESRTPRRYRCQPDLATENAPDDEVVGIETRLVPLFTSTEYGHPGYGQLDRRCAVEIREGGENETEMGAFHFLGQPQRMANLNTALAEYLRFGLEAGAFLVT